MKRRKLIARSDLYDELADDLCSPVDDPLDSVDGFDFGNFTDPQRRVARALIRCDGIISDAARVLRLTTQGVRYHLQRCPELAALRESCLDNLIDLAEAKLARAVRAGRAWAIRLVLLNHARAQARGWTTKIDVDLVGEVKMIALPERRLSETEWKTRFGDLDGSPLQFAPNEQPHDAG